ncbi:MAG: mycofactocin biosynthesis peptidyl-dipeptidase MftE [Nocardioidaceae bacterium]
MSRSLCAGTSPDVPAASLVLVPVGSVEQHGPHLPLDTDAVIAEAVAHCVADRLDRTDVLVAPPVAYGASGEHQVFAGTASVGSEALTLLLIELTRSMRTWASDVVFVNAHGGNTAALTRAVSLLVAEGHRVGWVPCVAEGADAHAGLTETSLMLHLRPEHVRLDRAQAGNTRPVGELLPALVAGGVGAVSSNGVLGDPAGASAAFGEHVLNLMADDVTALVRDGKPDQRGMLCMATAPVT